MKLYRIKDWDRHFEVSQTRKCARLTWVATPNKHDGKSYRRLMRHPDGAAIYGAWCLILQVASKCPERGVLSDGTDPLTAEDLALKTDCPEKWFDLALELLSTPEIGWLLVADYQHAPSTVERRDSTIQRDVATDRQTDRHNRTGQDRQKFSSEPVSPASELACNKPVEPQPEAKAARSVGAEANQRHGAPADSPPAPRATQEAKPPVEVSPTLMTFPCVGLGPNEWELTAAKIAEYQQAYPGVDVLGECRKARQWCVDNSTKRKTAKGMLPFLNRWLSQAQNDGPKTGFSGSRKESHGRPRSQTRVHGGSDFTGLFPPAPADSAARDGSELE